MQHRKIMVNTLIGLFIKGVYRIGTDTDYRLSFTT